ncbi:major facilitator superfamily domain-containing protein [Aspergillus bertholletiae]|uniref:Major facilitator superfamily domain-containing protein n=1 Tax=Aspergillus bertholletiae TaxID=1226010 RepID=A0A5N7BDF6_9EURO|nr:major facilitator superfamily domain-containing protein [Aspergillus bertholletiae]
MPENHSTHSSDAARTLSEPGQGTDYVDLPVRQVTREANLEEYTTETATGQIIKPVRSAASGKMEDWKLVTFTTDDPENPKNWSKAFKWYCTMVVAFTCFVVAFASSVITADIEGPAEEFGVSREVSLVVVTVFVIGFGVGPMAFAPMSEMFGRRPVYAFTLFIAVIFLIPCAVSKNIGTLIVCRAIDGIAFSAPMTLVGGTLADLWRNEERGVPMAAFSASPFLGPAIGPLAGGYLADAAGWRWLYWLTLILAFVSWVLITFTVPETYAPTILTRRAKKLRKTENDPKYVTETELDSRPMGEKLRIFLFRPFQLLFLEPIVFFISIYMSVLYGLLYMFFVAYPVVFQGGKGWSAGSTGLMFIPLAIGVVMSAACSPFINKHYLSLYEKYGGKPPAEARLIPMMFSCWFIPIGLFIFAWTSYPTIHWFGPAVGGWPVGFGFIFLYNSANNYLVDTYQHQAASALAAKTFLRSMWGASTVLFTEQMYDRLGDQWASTLLAFIALACCAIPYVFYFKGASIRRFSRFAYNEDEENTGKVEKS